MLDKEAFRQGLRACCFAAFFFVPFSGFSASKDDIPSSETLWRAASSFWLTPRRYDEVPKTDLGDTLQRDFCFDAWLAERARDAGYSLTDKDKAAIERHRRMVQNVYLKEALECRENPTSATIMHITESLGWTRPIPEKFEVSYIFIDDSQARSERERKAKEARAYRVKEHLTPENFETMARLWSDAPSSDDGGNLYVISLEDKGPTFSRHVRQTEPGTIGGPWRTPSGWNIMYVRRRIPPQEQNFSPEQLRSLAISFLASQDVKQVRQSPDLFEKAWTTFAKGREEDVCDELRWFENVILENRYIAALAEKEKPSEEDLKLLYDESKENFKIYPRRRAREILLTSDDWTTEPTKSGWLKRREVRDRARELRQELLAGADFAEMARTYSAAATASSGGDMGWVQMPSSFLVDTTLGALEPGEVSPPMATQKGYWLAKLEEEQPSRLMTFEEARHLLKERWLATRRRVLLDSLRSEWESSLENPLMPGKKP